MIARLAHRIRHGHWQEPWDVFLFTDTPDQGCWRCIKAAVLRDIADSERRIGGGGW